MILSNYTMLCLIMLWYIMSYLLNRAPSQTSKEGDQEFVFLHKRCCHTVWLAPAIHQNTLDGTSHPLINRRKHVWRRLATIKWHQTSTMDKKKGKNDCWDQSTLSFKCLLLWPQLCIIMNSQLRVCVRIFICDSFLVVWESRESQDKDPQQYPISF